MKKTYISPCTVSVAYRQTLLTTPSKQVEQLNDGGIGTPTDAPSGEGVPANARRRNVWDDEEEEDW